jgi:hypothetical protein
MILGFKTHISDYFFPKIHTIREGQRWKAGDNIQMATGVRTKKYCQFNAKYEGLHKVKSVQNISIARCDESPSDIWEGNVYEKTIVVRGIQFVAPFKITIDGRVLSIFEIILLTKNDGFQHPDHFFDWFKNNDFSGQLIHWTDYKY